MVTEEGRPLGPVVETYKFQKLDVYQLSLRYVNLIYEITSKLPMNEQFNLVSQANRAAVSITLNIAEGSTGQTNPEQDRFISYAQRSYLETIACLDLIELRLYKNPVDLIEVRELGHQLFIKLSAFRKALRK